MATELPPSQSRVALSTFDRSAAERAIYVDYEGILRRPPVILGWQIEGQYSGAIVDPAFQQCSGRYKAQSAVLVQHRDAIDQLLRKAFSEDRHLVSWSWHDLKLMWPHIPRSRRTAFIDRFVNALRLARPWHSKQFGAGLKRGFAKLSYFADAFGIPVPAKYGQKVVANHLDRVGKALLLKQTYGALEPNERSSWVAAVKHNQWDLKATVEVCRSVLEGRPPIAGFSLPPEAMSEGGASDA